MSLLDLQTKLLQDQLSAFSPLTMSEDLPLPQRVDFSGSQINGVSYRPYAITNTPLTPQLVDANFGKNTWRSIITPGIALQNPNLFANTLYYFLSLEPILFQGAPLHKMTPQITPPGSVCVIHGKVHVSTTNITPAPDINPKNFYDYQSYRIDAWEVMFFPSLDKVPATEDQDEIPDYLPNLIEFYVPMYLLHEEGTWQTHYPSA